MLECPFCGQDDVTIVEEGQYYHIRCTECEALGPASTNKAMAKALWNDRQ